MIPVLDRVKFEDLNEREHAMAWGMVTMFEDLGPFQTFGTITCRPRHDRCGVSSMTMERLMLKELRKRRFRDMAFTYFVENNKHRPGTHGHFTTKGEPSDLRWAGEGSVGEMMIEKYGRFQTRKVVGATKFGLAAYLAKYCSKEHADGHWGFVNFNKRDLVLQNKPPKQRSMTDRCQAPAVTADEKIKALEDAAAWKWQKGVGRKIRQHSGTRENGRLNVRTYEVREAGERFGHFEQEMIYNNAK